MHVKCKVFATIVIMEIAVIFFFVGDKVTANNCILLPIFIMEGHPSLNFRS